MILKSLREKSEEFIRKTNDQMSRLPPVLRIILGVVCLIVGLLAVVTPLTPGGWLTVVGIEALGLRAFFTKRFKK